MGKSPMNESLQLRESSNYFFQYVSIITSQPPSFLQSLAAGCSGKSLVPFQKNRHQQTLHNQKHGVIPYKRTASNPFSYCNMPLRSRLRRARQILEGEQASLRCIWVWVSGLTPGVIKIWEIPKLNGDLIEVTGSCRFFFAIFLRTKYEAYDVGRMVNKGNHPQMVNNYFRLVNYYGLFRLCI